MVKTRINETYSYIIVFETLMRQTRLTLDALSIQVKLRRMFNITTITFNIHVCSEIYVRHKVRTPYVKYMFINIC